MFYQNARGNPIHFFFFFIHFGDKKTFFAQCGLVCFCLLTNTGHKWTCILWLLLFLWVCMWHHQVHLDVNLQLKLCFVVARRVRPVRHVPIWGTACVVLYFFNRANCLVCWISLTLTLSVIVNKVTPVMDWLNQALIGEAFFGLLTFPPPGCIAKWVLPRRQEVDAHNWPGVYFRSQEDVWVGRKCARHFLFPE